MECNSVSPYAVRNIQTVNTIKENYVFISSIAKITVSDQKILAIVLKRFNEFSLEDGSTISLIRDKARLMTKLNHGLRFARLVSENKEVRLEIHEFWLKFVEETKIKYIYSNNKIGQFNITKLENYDAIVEKFFDKFLDVNEEDYAEEQDFDYEEDSRQYKDDVFETGSLKNACLHDTGSKEYEKTITNTGQKIYIRKTGSFCYGKLHGNGYKVVDNNNFEEGNFYYSNLHGKGLRVLNAERFEGEFWFGKFVSGTFKNSAGKEYKGAFKNGKLDNIGEELFNPKFNGIPINLKEITLEQKELKSAKPEDSKVEIALEQKEQKSDKPKDSKVKKLGKLLGNLSLRGSKSSSDQK